MEEIAENLAENVTEPAAEEEFPGLLKDNRGIGVIEMVLILVVLVGLVLIFKSQLTSIIGTVFDKVNSTVNKL
ncbi:MAG: hypothetical protein IK125_03000 [Lachnospiraceae bacterium]|nr:hypothetical protein [Lachnospiraceae bacterium]